MYRDIANESEVKLSLKENISNNIFNFSEELNNKININILLEALDKLSETNYNENKNFTAKVYKIKIEENKQKLMFIKILSGKIKLKEEVCYKNNDKIIKEKINEIRIYNGDKYIKRDEAFAGKIVAYLLKVVLILMI